jgi:hypothetical protein
VDWIFPEKPFIRNGLFSDIFAKIAGIRRFSRRGARAREGEINNSDTFTP